MLKLFTTSHCHLCDDALMLLLQVCDTQEVSIIEISENDGLMITYGTRIPVLQRLDTNAELNWPFDNKTLMEFLAN
ncbi:MAG: glutaredoxin family protein [Methylophilaceae bacterium]